MHKKVQLFCPKERMRKIRWKKRKKLSTFLQDRAGLKNRLIHKVIHLIHIFVDNFLSKKSLSRRKYVLLCLLFLTGGLFYGNSFFDSGGEKRKQIPAGGQKRSKSPQAAKKKQIPAGGGKEANTRDWQKEEIILGKINNFSNSACEFLYICYNNFIGWDGNCRVHGVKGSVDLSGFI